MHRKSITVGTVTLLAVLSLTACGQDQQRPCNSPAAAGAPGLLMVVDIPEKGGGGGGHGGSGGHGASEGHAAEGGDHANSGQAHPDLPHPPSAPEKLPAPQTDDAHPGYVKYPGWPGYYRPGTYPYGYGHYYDCKEQTDS